jgi:hypothetical protein
VPASVTVVETRTVVETHNGGRNIDQINSAHETVSAKLCVRQVTADSPVIWQSPRLDGDPTLYRFDVAKRRSMIALRRLLRLPTRGRSLGFVAARGARERIAIPLAKLSDTVVVRMLVAPKALSSCVPRSNFHDDGRAVRWASRATSASSPGDIGYDRAPRRSRMLGRWADSSVPRRRRCVEQ